MSTEVWGTFSVQDHLAERAFIADVLLYDRLVIPTKPEGQDLADWPKEWDLARQQQLFDVLGDLAVPIPWTEDVRAAWKTNYEDALGKDRRRGKSDAVFKVGFDIGRVQACPDDFHLHVTRMLLADFANEVADSRLFDRLRATVKARPGAKVEAVAAYQNYDNFQMDVLFADSNIPEGHRLVAPTAIFGWDFVVPESEEAGREEDLKLLKKAVKMASTGEFIELRSGLNDWLADVSVGISKGALTPDEARADMEKRVSDYQKFMKGQAWKKIIKRAVKLGLAFAGTLKFIDEKAALSGEVFFGLADVYADEIEVDVTDPRTRVAAMFHEAHGKFHWKPLQRSILNLR
jgi:hypothetical protein